MPGDAPEPAGPPSIGRYVTVVFGAAPDGVAYAMVSQDARRLTLEALQRSGESPYPGERVTCVSVGGPWTTTVHSLHDGILELATPRWLSRSAHRRSRRVVVAHPAQLHTKTGDWAARLQDVSLGGAALLVERAVALRPGEPVQVDLGDGTATATVRSVRPHAHPLLVVVGLSCDRLDPPAQRWIAAQVASGRDVVRPAHR